MCVCVCGGGPENGIEPTTPPTDSKLYTKRKHLAANPHPVETKQATMRQQRITRERSRSRTPDPVGWASALQTNCPMGTTKCRQPAHYHRGRRSPMTVSSHIQSPKNRNAVKRATSGETPHRKSVIHGAKRATNINNERANTNTQDSNATNDTDKKTCRAKTINIEAAHASVNDISTQNAPSAHP